MAVPFKTPQTEKEWRKFRNQVQKLVNRANSQLEKLERENLENSPAYRTFTTNEGRSRFGIKGKTNEEVNEEFQKVKAFLDNTTNTVKGAKNYIKGMAKITGLSYGEVQGQLPNFWKIADAVRNSLKAAQMSYLALDSERVVQAVRGVIQTQKSGADRIENLGEAVEIAWAQLEKELPNAFEEDTNKYLESYLRDLGLKNVTIDLWLD